MTLATKPVTRETMTTGERRRPLLVTLDNFTLRFREKGTRRTYTVSLAACYWLAIKQEAREQERVKKAAKEEQRKARRKH